MNDHKWSGDFDTPFSGGEVLDSLVIHPVSGKLVTQDEYLKWLNTKKAEE